MPAIPAMVMPIPSVINGACGYSGKGGSDGGCGDGGWRGDGGGGRDIPLSCYMGRAAGGDIRPCGQRRSWRARPPERRSTLRNQTPLGPLYTTQHDGNP